MNTLRKLIIAFLGLAIAIAISIMVMIKGWGLEPKSWWWIIGVYFFGQLFAQFLIAISRSGDE